MNGFPLIAFIPVGLLYAISFYCIFQTDKALAISAKYFMWTMKIYGFEGEMHPTPNAKIICRCWNVFIVVALSVYLFVILPALLR